MPGQTEKDVKLAIAHFSQKIRDLENYNSDSEPSLPSRRSSLDSSRLQMRPSSVSRTPSSEHLQNSIALEQPVAGPSRLKPAPNTVTSTDRRSSYPISNLEKRKPSADTLEDDQPMSKKVRWRSLAPSSSCSSIDMSPHPSKRLTTDTLPGIKVRDFAYEPYDGPQGYYVPDPFREAVMATERRRHIRLQNGKAMDQVLRQATLAQRIGYSRMRHAAEENQQKMKGMRSLGRLKRVLDELADPVLEPSGNTIKRPKYDHGLGRSIKGKHKRAEDTHPSASSSAGDENRQSAPFSSLAPLRRNSITSTAQPKPILRKSAQGLNGEAQHANNVTVDLTGVDVMPSSSSSQVQSSMWSFDIFGSRYTSRRSAKGSRIAPTYALRSHVPIRPVWAPSSGTLQRSDDDAEQATRTDNPSGPVAAKKPPCANSNFEPLPESEMKTMEEDPYSLAAQMAWATLGLRPFPPRHHRSRVQQVPSLDGSHLGNFVATAAASDSTSRSHQRQFQSSQLSFSARFPHISPNSVVPVDDPGATDDDDSAEEEEVALMLMMSSSPTSDKSEVSQDVYDSSGSISSSWWCWWQRFFR
jgi:hypothetical protein